MGTIYCFLVLTLLGVVLPLLAVRAFDESPSFWPAAFASIVGGTGAFVIAWWVRPPLMFPGAALSTCIVLTLGLTLLCLGLSSTSENKAFGLGMTAAVIFVLWNSGVILSSWDVFRAHDYAAVIGNVVEHSQEETAHIAAIDFTHPRLNTPNQVELKFRSDRSQLGEQASLVDFNDIWPTADDKWIGAIEPIPADPFGFGKLLQQGGLKGYFTVSADDPLSTPELHRLEDGIKFTPTSFGKYNTDRAVYNRMPNRAVIYRNLHVSESTGHPENVVSLGGPMIGFEMNMVSHVAVQDTITGALRIYSLEDLPEEYQLVLPSSVVVNAFDAWGSYRMGWYQHAFGRSNLEHVARRGASTEPGRQSSSPEVWLVKGNDGRFKYYLSIQYRNTSGSIDGYALVDTRNWKTEIFEQPAADPEVVRSTMQSNAPATSGHPWMASEPKQFETRHGLSVWIATYSSQGAFQAIGVADRQGNIAAWGRTTDAAMEAFQARLYESPDLLGELASVESKVVTLTGRNYTVTDNGQSVMVFEVEGQSEPIEVRWGGISAEMPFDPKGTQVQVDFLQFNGRPLLNHGAIRASKVTPIE
jgi:hypothetical protein